MGKGSIFTILLIYIAACAVSFALTAGILYLICALLSLDIWSWRLSLAVWLVLWLISGTRSGHGD